MAKTPLAKSDSLLAPWMPQAERKTYLEDEAAITSFEDYSNLGGILNREYFEIVVSGARQEPNPEIDSTTKEQLHDMASFAGVIAPE